MPKVEILNKLELFIPTSIEAPNIAKLNLSTEHSQSTYHQADNHHFFCSDYYHYPFITDEDGSLWEEGNRYILSKLRSFNLPSHRTLESIAYDLASFKKWLDDEEIDFLKITPRPRTRPTYRYAAYLHGEVELGNIKTSTARRRISSMQGFYRWLKEDRGDFLYDLWNESELSLSFKGSYGSSKLKTVSSTDLTRSFKVPKSSDDYSDFIQDGGKLRPLPQNEQAALIEALLSISNTEMTLSFLLALTTGARLQTVFTLRHGNFNQDTHRETLFYRVNVGGNTLVDTKFNKEIVIHIPKWLYIKIKVYLASERHKTRHIRSLLSDQKTSEQYVFLTRSGQPYYMAKNDSSNYSYATPPRGNAVTQFIRQQLKPKLLEQGHKFDIRFHDLRATFGMNLLDEKLKETPLTGAGLRSNQPEFLNILTYVQARMGHSQIRTTEAYINYREKCQIANQIQSEFESYLEQLITKNDGGKYGLET